MINLSNNKIMKVAIETLNYKIQINKIIISNKINYIKTQRLCNHHQ